MTLSQLDAILAATRCFGGRDVAGWTLDLAITVPLAIVALLYAVGVARLWRHAAAGMGVSLSAFLGFTTGWIILLLALISPLHAIAGQLFSAHMVEHEAIMAVAAPLLVLSRPLRALLWAVPQPWRVQAGRMARLVPIAALWRILTVPIVATILHGVAIWVWHAPPLFNAALAHVWLHWVQHASFLLTALLFWWAVANSRAGGTGRAVAHLFVTSVHTTILGALLALAPRALYAIDAAATGAWGLTPLEDQQLAGLIMWVPGGMIYAGAALYFAGKWIAKGGAGVNAASPLT